MMHCGVGAWGLSLFVQVFILQLTKIQVQKENWYLFWGYWCYILFGIKQCLSQQNQANPRVDVTLFVWNWKSD